MGVCGRDIQGTLRNPPILRNPQILRNPPILRNPQIFRNPQIRGSAAGKATTMTTATATIAAAAAAATSIASIAAIAADVAADATTFTIALATVGQLGTGHVPTGQLHIILEQSRRNASVACEVPLQKYHLSGVGVG